MRRLLALAAAAWIGRWALLELASLAGRRWVPPASPDPDRRPGRMPGHRGR